MKNIQEKKEALLTYLRSVEHLAVCFSGGVDSALLLKMAKEALGNNVIAMTANLRSFPERECKTTKEFCEKEGIRQIIVPFDELKLPGFENNPKNRCYLCKKALFGKIIEEAKKLGFTHVAEGSNLDDNGDYRPGLIAIEELHVLSPLREIGFTKEDIRLLARLEGIPVWNKPSFACLSSRFPYGEMITAEKLFLVEKGEEYLLRQGFTQFRVRIHGDLARVELLPKEFDRMMEEEARTAFYQYMKELGFSYVALDLQGYRMGSMNEVLKK